MRVLLSDPSELRSPLERAPRPTTRAVSSKYCQMKPCGIFQRLKGGVQRLGGAPRFALPGLGGLGDIHTQGVRLGEVAEVAQIVSLEDPHGPVVAAAEHQLLADADAGGERHLGPEARRGASPGSPTTVFWGCSLYF